MSANPANINSNNNHLLKVGQAASFLGVSTKTLRQWDDKNILLSKRTKGGQRRYYQSALDKFKKQREVFKNHQNNKKSAPLSIPRCKNKIRANPYFPLPHH